MFGIYEYRNGLKFTGIVTATEEEAWAYLDDKYGRVWNGIKFKCNRSAFAIKKIKIV
jgi:hypothetical protein